MLILGDMRNPTDGTTSANSVRFFTTDTEESADTALLVLNAKSRAILSEILSGWVEDATIALDYDLMDEADTDKLTAKLAWAEEVLNRVNAEIANVSV